MVEALRDRGGVREVYGTTKKANQITSRNESAAADLGLFRDVPDPERGSVRAGPSKRPVNPRPKVLGVMDLTGDEPETSDGSSIVESDIREKEQIDSKADVCRTEDAHSSDSKARADAPRWGRDSDANRGASAGTAQKSDDFQKEIKVLLNVKRNRPVVMFSHHDVSPRKRQKPPRNAARRLAVLREREERISRGTTSRRTVLFNDGEKKETPSRRSASPTSERTRTNTKKTLRRRWVALEEIRRNESAETKTGETAHAVWCDGN